MNASISRLEDDRTIEIACSLEEAFNQIHNLGGANGWLYLDFLWRIRGAIDLALGGVGIRSQARPAKLARGDILDWWRVEECQPPNRLYLKAEMRLPGEAWLRFEVNPKGNGCTVRQHALFLTGSLLGQLYWYALLPIHKIMFRGLLQRIKQNCELHHAQVDNTTAPL